MQLNLTLDNSPESPEILTLISHAKAGDEIAYEELYYRYKELIEGRFIHRIIKRYKVPDYDLEDAVSIIRLIFHKSVLSYKPEKCKFITYFVKFVQWKFVAYYSEERLISVPTTDTAINVMNSLDMTRVPSIGGVNEILEFNDSSHSRTLVKFEIEKQEYSMPLIVFFQKYIIDNIDELISDDCTELYKQYINEYIQDSNNVFKNLSEKTGKPRTRIIKCIYRCNNRIKDKFKFKNFKIVVE